MRTNHAKIVSPNSKAMNVDTLDQEYEETVKNLADYSLELTELAASDTILFRVEPTIEVVNTYLNSFTEPEARNYFNCNCCKHFLKRYGTAVYVTPTGQLKSIIWNPDVAVGHFKGIVKMFKEAVEGGRIIDIIRFNMSADKTFYDDMITLGQKTCGGYNHFHANISNKYISQISHTTGTVIDVVRSVSNMLSVYNINTVTKAYTLAKIDRLNKPEAKDRLNLLKQVIEDLNNTKPVFRNNKIWNYAIKYMDVLYGFSNTVEGMLLTDISNGVDIDTCIARFNAGVDPLNYKRPKSLPTKNLVEEAEKAINELNLKDSLDRRIARFDEIKRFLWKPPVEVKEETKSDSIFANVETKESASKKIDDIEIDLTKYRIKITAQRFLKEIAPRTKQMNIGLFGYRYPFCSFVTEAHEGSTPILEYDKMENRNPINIYCYRNGRSPESFNIRNTPTVEVIGIATAPRDIDVPEDELTAMIFILRDCRDTRLDGGSALFPDDLIPELYPYRKVIENYSANKQITDIGKDEQAAAGLIVSGNDMKYLITIETVDNTLESYIIDRMK